MTVPRITLTSAALTAWPITAWARDPSGVAGLVLYIVLAVVAVCAIVGLAMAFKAKTRAGAAIALVLGTLPITSCVGIVLVDDVMASFRRADEAKVAAPTLKYLESVCQRDRRSISTAPIEPGAGVLIQREDRNELGLRPELKPDDVPRHLPPQDQQRLQDAAYVWKYQFSDPIDWVRRANLIAVLKSSRLLYVEQSEKPGELPVQIVGRKSWWLEEGRSRISLKGQERFDRETARESEDIHSNGHLLPLRSTARYVLTAEDVSSPEDRDHWVARARLRLTDRETNEMVAEYVGFVGAPHRRKGHPPWTGTSGCAGKESSYGRWMVGFDAITFFFAEVVRYSEPVK